MASKQVSGLGKLGRRVAAATADRARNTRAMLGFIVRCSGVVPPGTTSLTLEEAQYYLGQAFMNGTGVNRDVKKAVEWYQKAADAGHALEARGRVVDDPLVGQVAGIVVVDIVVLAARYLT